MSARYTAWTFTREPFRSLSCGDGRLLMRDYTRAANIVSEVIRKYKMAGGPWTIGSG
jgi:hypothetical protein